MSDFLLSVMPGMMVKYDYAHSLLQWAKERFGEIKAHREKATHNYPRMEPLLLDSLEKVSHDLGSVPLLKFVIELRALDGKLQEANAKPQDDALAIDTYFGLEDDIPKLEADLKTNLTIYAAKSLLFFGVLVVVIVYPLVVLVHCSAPF
jgi:hypothetical protein